MDELLIDEKKYVSSKRAAKITGYAKDYIGQLCREGRVPARLVGRSWYVLESAIQDHRFGPPVAVEKEPIVKAPEPPESLPTWEPPRYEAIPPEPLPEINLLREDVENQSPIADVEKEAQEPGTGSPTENLMDSWRNWFDQLAEIEPDTPAHKEKAQKEVNAAELPSYETHPVEEEESVDIPIHTVYDLPPRELLPRQKEKGEQIEETAIETEEVPHKRLQRAVYAAVRLVGVIVAVTAAGIALTGSGYIDKYVASVTQASVITGISIYEK